MPKSNKRTLNQTKPDLTMNDNSTSSVPDFIQKLFRMLENNDFKDIFCWSDDGTTFIVKDINDFAKGVLPKHFKHCNFASFVRQLNKYDFHKVRNATTDDGQKTFGDQAWEFVHPKFIRDRNDLLEEIKRKAPGNKQPKTQVKVQSELQEIDRFNTSIKQEEQEYNMNDFSVKSMQEIRGIGLDLQSQIDQLKKSRLNLQENITKLTQKDTDIMTELTNFNKSMTVKDDLVKKFLRLLGEKEYKGSDTAQNLLDKYDQLSQTSLKQMNKLNEQLGLGVNVKQQQPVINKTISQIQQEEQQQQQQLASVLGISDNDAETMSAAAAAAATMNGGSLIGSPLKTADGLAFVTLGRLSSNMAVRDNKPAIEILPSGQTPTLATSLQRPTNSNSSNISNQNGSSPSPATATSVGLSPTSSSNSSATTSQVSWTVPPRILLVDDDSVYRDLSGKLLQVIGCTIDLAKNGIEALKKMGSEKYDLILMDIVMPQMDGISATRSIRQYDALTPIISMTSNFTDNDIMQYIGSGMTDILPKPFSKRTLYQMLEKYCAHLKTIQRVQNVQEPNSSNNNTSNLPSNMSVPTTSTTHSELTATLPLSYASSSANTPPTPSNISVTASSTNTSTSTTPTAFPLAPYPYPVTMNSVPTDISNGNFDNMINNDIPNITFWPQHPPHQLQQLDTPPAIIPNDGKFTWAVPSNSNNSQQQVFDAVTVLNQESNKKPKTSF